MFKRLRNRLLLLNMTIISIVIVVALAIIYFMTYTNIQKENQDKLESIPIFAAIASGAPDIQAPQVNLVRVPVDYSPSFAILVDSNGQVMDVLSYIDMPDEVYYQVAEEMWSTGRQEGTISFENRKWQYRISPLEHKIVVRENGQRVVYGEGLYQMAFLDITDSSMTLTRLLITLVLVGIAMLFFLFGVSFHFANRSIRPIEDSWRKQKQFVADASHELKTPLAIINANTDALLASGGRTVNSQKKWIDYIRSEAGRMSKLVNDMLYLAKAEDTRKGQTPFDVSNTVLDAIASMEAVMFEKGIRLTQSIEPNVIVKGDGEEIKQAVLILLDNAVKYTDENGGVVDITLRRSRGRAVLSITNSGKGIPTDELPVVFDRFYRCDPSRSRETDGYGLGLSIAKAIVEGSGGSIHAESTETSTTLTVVLKS